MFVFELSTIRTVERVKSGHFQTASELQNVTQHGRSPLTVFGYETFAVGGQMDTTLFMENTGFSEAAARMA